jgi:hypothetical protein
MPFFPFSQTLSLDSCDLPNMTANILQTLYHKDYSQIMIPLGEDGYLSKIPDAAFKATIRAFLVMG